MAFRIIIDGYNLIGSDRGLRGDLEGKRKQLIQRLQQYCESKGHPITLVFDGWRSGWVHESQEQTGGITVIFSRQGEKADSVIQRLAREMGSGCVVVTSDREVRRAAEVAGAAAIYSGEFGARLQTFDRETFHDEEDVTDHLSEQDIQFQGKRGNPRRLSKRERKRRERLKKL
ncbi:MAG: NYN domain-containing protein [Candidatus Binatia bacterium]